MLPTATLFGDENLDITIGFVWASLLAFGPVVELLQVFVGAYLIRLTGSWLGGKAGSTGLQAAIVWGNLPIAVMTVLGIVAVGFSVIHTGLAEEPLRWGQSPVITGLGWTLVAMQAVLLVWSFAILVSGVAVLQGFSRVRAVFNALLAWFVAAALLALATIALGLSDKLAWLFFSGASELAGIHAPG